MGFGSGVGHYRHEGKHSSYVWQGFVEEIWDVVLFQCSSKDKAIPRSIWIVIVYKESLW